MKKMCTNCKFFLYAIISITFGVSIIIFAWKYNIEKIQCIHKDELYKNVQENITRHINDHLFENNTILLLNNDSIVINNKVLSKLKNYLSTKYLNRDTIAYDSTIQLFELHEFKNQNGQYVLSEKQLNSLKYYIQYIEKKIEQSIELNRTELDRDINRLNWWISLWIAAIGALGIFVPILINFNIANRVDKLSEKTDDINKTNDLVNKNLSDSSDKLDKIDGSVTKLEDEIKYIETIAAKLNAAEARLTNIESTSTEAESKSKIAHDKAEKTELILQLVSSIQALGYLDPEHLIRISHPIDYLKKALSTIHTRLSSCNKYYQERILNNNLVQLGLTLHTLSYYKFATPSIVRNLNEYSKKIENYFSSAQTQESYLTLVQELDDLVNSLPTN